MMPGVLKNMKPDFRGADLFLTSNFEFLSDYRLRQKTGVESPESVLNVLVSSPQLAVNVENSIEKTTEISLKTIEKH
jgi:hypothetical protein